MLPFLDDYATQDSTCQRSGGPLRLLRTGDYGFVATANGVMIGHGKLAGSAYSEANQRRI
jgi:hypothetical protein